MRPCDDCGVRGGMHRTGCPIITPGPVLARAPRPVLPHDLLAIVRRITSNPLRPLREDPAHEGTRAITLLVQAAIYAAHVGLDPLTLADAAKVVIRYVYEEMGAVQE